MVRSKEANRLPQHWHLVLVDGVSILITVCASLDMRLGTLTIGPYVHRIRLAILLLVFLRLSLFAVLGLYRPIRVPFPRWAIVSLIGSVILSSSITALLVLGFAFPLGVVQWFPRSLLIIELLPGIIMAGVIRLSQSAWDSSVAAMSPERLRVMRARANLSIVVLFVVLMAVLFWQALSLGADLVPADWGSLLSAIPAIFLSAILFLLPGYALLAILRPRMHLDPLEALIVSAGLSVAVIPLLLYLCSLIGIPLNSRSVGAILLLLGATALWRSRSAMRRVIDTIRLRWSERVWQPSLRKTHSRVTGALSETHMFYATLVMIFLMALLVRLWVVKDLVAPLGGDSVHHTMITQLLVDHGGLFSSWEPYAPLTSFTYHFGFHALSAFYHWLTGIPVIKSVIIVGQIINALAVPLMYLLTKRLTKSRWAGLIAALIPGFLSLMPMYYVNWGRYTQLAGQTILPVAMLLGVEALFARRVSVGLIAITAITLAGLILTHYRVTLYYFCFLAPMLGWSTYDRRHRTKDVAAAWLKVVSVVLLAAVLTAPWLWNGLRGPFVLRMTGALTPEIPRAATSWAEQFNGVLTFSATGTAFFFLPEYVFVLFALGAVWGAIQRRKEIIIIICWTALLFYLLANPHVLHLPIRRLASNTAIMIALYIPASVVSGHSVARFIDSCRAKMPRARRCAAIGALLCLLTGYDSMASALTPDNVPVTESDMTAMAWIKDHADPSSKFLVSTVLWKGPQTVIGLDAGWWLPLLAERVGTVPPMLYKDERSSDPHYALKTNAFAETIENADFGDGATVRWLQGQGITHIYIGQRQERLQPEVFADSACYDLVYQDQEVWIFEVSSSCTCVEQPNTSQERCPSRPITLPRRERTAMRV